MPTFLPNSKVNKLLLLAGPKNATCESCLAIVGRRHSRWNDLACAAERSDVARVRRRPNRDVAPLGAASALAVLRVWIQVQRFAPAFGSSDASDAFGRHFEGATAARIEHQANLATT